MTVIGLYSNGLHTNGFSPLEVYLKMKIKQTFRMDIPFPVILMKSNFKRC